MSRRIRGITVEIGGDTTKLGKALSETTGKSKELQSELRGINTLLKYDPKNIVLAQQRQDVLTESVENTRKRLDQLRGAQESVQAQFDRGEITVEQYRDFQREIEYTERRLSGYEAQLAKVSKEHRDFFDSADQASKKLKEVGDKMVDVGKDMSLKVTAPLVAVGTLSAKAAVDFETAFAGVRKTVDATEEEFEALEQGIRNMAKELPASAGEIAGVAEAAGQLGIANENILDFTRTIIDLGESTNLSLEQASTEFARFANITQMSQDDFSRLGSAVVDLGNNFATTESEIVSLGMRLAAQGAQIGLSEAEIMALSTTMSSLGLSAEAGGTAMSTVMKKIQVAVDEGGDSLKGFADIAGVSSEEFALSFQEKPIEAIDAFIKGLDRTSQEGGNLTSTLGELGISGIRETDTLLRMAGASDLLSEAVQTSTNAWSENTALTEEAQQRYDTFQSKMDVVKNKLVDVGIQIGEILMPILEKILDWVGKAIDWFGGLDSSIQTIIVVIASIVAAIAPLLIIGGKIALGVSNILALFVKLKPVFLAAKVAIAGLSAPLILIVAKVTAVIAIVVAVIAIFKNWGAISDWLKNVWGAFADWLGNTWDSIKNKTVEIFTGLGEWLKNVWESIKNSVVNAVTSIVDGVVNVFNTLTEKVGFIFDGIREIIGNIIVGISENLFSVFGGMINHVQIIFNGFVEVIRNIFTILYNVITAPVQLIVAFVTGGFEGMRDKAVEIFNNILSAISGIVNAIKNTVVAVVTNIRDTAVAIFENTKERIINVFTAIKDTVTQIIENVKETISNVFETIKEFLITTVENIKTGVVDGFNNMKEWVTTTITNLKDSIVNIWNTIKNFIVTTIDNIKNGVTNGFRNAVNGAEQIFNNFKTTVKNIFTTIKNTILNLMKIDLKQIGSDIMNGLVSGINGAIGKVKDAVSNVGKTITNDFKKFFGIKSPSTLMRDVIGKMLPQGIAVGIEADTDDALEAVDDMNRAILDASQPDMVNLMNGKPLTSQNSQLERLMGAVGGDSGMSGKLDRLIEVFDTYLARLSDPKYQVVLENGVLVGELRGALDQALGQTQEMKGRYRE
ncbi:phage tail tape measure protein [Thiopseudomonas sp. 4R-3cl]|nr:phage tail tape measure protein [Thiopseudomonas sp. 4R-3cl]